MTNNKTDSIDLGCCLEQKRVEMLKESDTSMEGIKQSS